ncbi:Uncharacterized conserved protein (DUF2215) [Nesidiocoris tenuis]|uniref:Uncharacterized conserved protein (DUF2215) n=1 Tax=Nesidiocoris tenuis TaxID=355587 RepID=A0ABN7ASI2_9HEMI|nr:Uncharacterized conserved protein (DUF2215) [Nesidiocoris tenuis]
MWLLAIFVFLLPPAESTKYSVINLVDDTQEPLECCSPFRKDLMIYCYKGEYKHVFQLWSTVQIHLSLPPDQYTYYVAPTKDEVVSKFTNDVSSWAFNMFALKRKSIKINPFNSTCVGIATKHDFTLKLQHIRFDYWRLLLFTVGVLLYFSAPKLSSNSLFYYLTGVSVGVLASVLIVVYLMRRFIPKKPVMFGFLAGGWTVSMYMAHLVWDNIRTLLVDHKVYVLYYVLATGTISFYVCYRLGPVSDPRSMDLIKWTLQIASLVMIYCSTELQSADFALVILVLVSDYTPFRKITKPFHWLAKKFRSPPPHRFLTEEEYYLQGVEETKKSLEELRQFCNSPECKQWSTILKLKDPVRFAEFVNGSSHLRDEEVLAFETDGRSNSSRELITDDSDSSGSQQD